MSKINGAPNRKGDQHGKPIPADDKPAGCPFAAAGAIAALVASIAAARAALSTPLTPPRRGQLPRKV